MKMTELKPFTIRFLSKERKFETMKYYVTYKIDARYVAEVEAENAEEAKKKAESNFYDANFGEAQGIDGEAIIVEDNNGNYVWER